MLMYERRKDLKANISRDRLVEQAGGVTKTAADDR